MLAVNPPEETPRIPAMTGPEGFHPVRPIRVHVARDEELGLDDEYEVDHADLLGDDDPEKKKEVKVAPPPPAYGLWRSSVRVNPNLLHWQRVEPAPEPTPALQRGTVLFDNNARTGSVVAGGPEDALQQLERARTQEQTGPRPPSYVSDDGVSYVVDATPQIAPRASVAQSHTGVSDIHPAWRPGYAISEVTLWPGAPTRV